MTTSSSVTPSIAFVIQEKQYGGASRTVLDALTYLSQAGRQAYLFSNAKNSWLGQSIREKSLATITVYTDWIQRGFNLLKDVVVIGWLSRQFARHCPDIIVLGGAKLILQGALAAKILGHRCVIVRVHGFGCSTTSRYWGLTVKIYRLLSTMGCYFSVLSTSDYNVLVAGMSIPASQVRLQYNGCQVDWVQSGHKETFRRQWQLPQEALIIGMVGRFCGQKRFNDFVAVMVALCNQYSHVYGVLIGEGEGRGNLAEQIRLSGLSNRILMPGFIAKMPDVYAGLDIAVLLSNYEGLPCALVESALCGLPIVASNLGGNPDIVAEGENGFLVNDVAEAITACSTLIEDTSRRIAMGEASKQRGSLLFDDAKNTPALIAQFDAFWATAAL